jgi:hypothetical protein
MQYVNLISRLLELPNNDNFSKYGKYELRELVYDVHMDTLAKGIKYVLGEEFHHQFMINKKIKNCNMLKILQGLGVPSQEYPRHITHAQVANAYSISHYKLRQWLRDSEMFQPIKDMWLQLCHIFPIQLQCLTEEYAGLEIPFEEVIKI